MSDRTTRKRITLSPTARIAVAVAVLALLAVGARYVLIGWRQMQVFAGGVQGPLIDNVQSPKLSDSYNENARWTNELLHAHRSWTIDDAKPLAAILKADYDRERIKRKDTTLADLVPSFIYLNALGAVLQRLARDMPIDEDAERFLIDTLFAKLDSSNLTVRLDTLGMLFMRGLVERPRIRAKIVALQSDPDPEVAQHALESLAHYDKIIAAGAKHEEIRKKKRSR